MRELDMAQAVAGRIMGWSLEPNYGTGRHWSFDSSDRDGGITSCGKSWPELAVIWMAQQFVSRHHQVSHCHSQSVC